MKALFEGIRCHYVLCFLLVLHVMGICCFAQGINWDKQLVDGVQLTGNYDTRYLNADPSVDITVQGHSKQEANNLVSGSDPGGKTGISWTEGQKISILIDMKVKRLLSGIAINKRGQNIFVGNFHFARWTGSGREISKDRFTDAADLVAANLALPARYLRIEGTAG